MTDIDWKALQAPIEAKYIKTRPSNFGKDLSYVDAPALMQRLDEVLTPAGWFTSEELTWNGNVPTVSCALTVVVSADDGGLYFVTKVGWGGPNNVGRSTSESGRTHYNKEKDKQVPAKDGILYVEDQEPVKSAASDAFRRACRKWGIGRELWMQGTQASSQRRSTQSAGAGSGDADLGVCPVHQKPFTPGKYGGYCQTKIGDKDGEAQWCKEKPPKAAPQEEASEEAPPATKEELLAEIQGMLLEDGKGPSEIMATIQLFCAETKMAGTPPEDFNDPRWSVTRLKMFRDWLRKQGD